MRARIVREGRGRRARLPSRPHTRRVCASVCGGWRGGQALELLTLDLNYIAEEGASDIRAAAHPDCHIHL